MQRGGSLTGQFGVCLAVVALGVVALMVGLNRSANAAPARAADLAAKVRTLQLQVTQLKQDVRAIEGPGLPPGPGSTWNLQNLTRTVISDDGKLANICARNQVVTDVFQASPSSRISVDTAHC